MFTYLSYVQSHAEIRLGHYRHFIAHINFTRVGGLCILTDNQIQLFYSLLDCFLIIISSLKVQLLLTSQPGRCSLELPHWLGVEVALWPSLRVIPLPYRKLFHPLVGQIQLPQS